MPSAEKANDPRKTADFGETGLFGSSGIKSDFPERLLSESLGKANEFSLDFSNIIKK